MSKLFKAGDVVLVEATVKFDQDLADTSVHVTCVGSYSTTPVSPDAVRLVRPNLVKGVKVDLPEYEPPAGWEVVSADGQFVWVRRPVAEEFDGFVQMVVAGTAIVRAEPPPPEPPHELPPGADLVEPTAPHADDDMVEF